MADKEAPALRFAVGEWIFVFTPNTKKIEICRSNRPDLAHLTIDFDAYGGTVDVHLTFKHESSGGDTRKKQYDSIAKVHIDTLRTLTLDKLRELRQSYETVLKKRYRRFRPGWLSRNGYVVVITERERVEAWLQENVPKKRGKYRPNFEALGSPPPHLEGELWDSSILNLLGEPDIAIGVASPNGPMISAVPLSGEATRVILLSRFTIPGKGVGWWGIPSGEVSSLYNGLVSPLFDWLLTMVKPEHIAVWERIVSGLAMEDSQSGQDFANSVRTLLREKRNPVSKPLKRPIR